MITNADIWDKLVAHGVVTCERPIKDKTYRTAVRYMTQKMLEMIVNGEGLTHLQSYVEEYQRAAEVELTERNLLGKKRLEMPV